MPNPRLIITAVVLEGRTQADVARDYGVSPGWVSKLVARYRTDGDLAFEPRSRRPKTSPAALAPDVIALILDQRTTLHDNGLDAGCDSIAWHLQHHHNTRVSTSTIHRYLTAAGVVIPEPKKRPKSSYIRFEADQPNECWQSDFTHWALANGTDIEIIVWIDDHSRYALSVTAHQPVTGAIVTATFQHNTDKHGIPASTLTDNGFVYTTRFAGGRGGINSFETVLARHNVVQKNSRPNHPTTCGKVERFHQTLKKWLRSQPRATTISDLQHQLDQFVHIYNHDRPHRSLPHRATPATIYQARPKATPGTADPDDRQRVRVDRVDNSGKLTLRHDGRLHHIGIGREHARTHVTMLIDGLNIRIVHAATGELLRDLTLDPTTDYQPTGKSRARKAQNPRT